MSKESGSPLATFGVMLILIGCAAGFAAPFATNGQHFAMMAGGAFAGAFAVWTVVRLIGFLSDPRQKQPPDPP